MSAPEGKGFVGRGRDGKGFDGRGRGISISVPGGISGGGGLLGGGADFKLSLCCAFSILAANVISALGSEKNKQTH